MKTNQNPNNSYQENNININIYNDISLDEIIKEEDYKINTFIIEKNAKI